MKLGPIFGQGRNLTFFSTHFHFWKEIYFHSLEIGGSQPARQTSSIELKLWRTCARAHRTLRVQHTRPIALVLSPVCLSVCFLLPSRKHMISKTLFACMHVVDLVPTTRSSSPNMPPVRELMLVIGSSSVLPSRPFRPEIKKWCVTWWHLMAGQLRTRTYLFCFLP